MTKVRLLLASVEAYLDEYRLDKGRQVRDGIREFQTLLNVQASTAVSGEYLHPIDSR